VQGRAYVSIERKVEFEGRVMYSGQPAGTAPGLSTSASSYLLVPYSAEIGVLVAQ